MGKIRDKQESYGQYRSPKCQFLNLCITFFCMKRRSYIVVTSCVVGGMGLVMIIT